MNLAIVLLGLVTGWYWERYATNPRGDSTTLFASVVILIGRKNLHIHHWVYYFVLFIGSAYWYSSYDGFYPRIALFILTFCAAAMIYNFKKYPDWHKFIR